MTIKDLARLSGYSLGTVSRVLNNQPNVSDKARAAILAIAEESGFELNESAQLLKQQRSNAVLIIVKGTANEMFASMVEQLQSLFSRTTHPLIVDFIDEDENEVLRAVKLCRERKPVGVMFLGGTNRYFCGDFEKIHVPAVVVTNDASELPFENLSSVTTNDRQGAACAVDYLIRCGHRQIAVLGGDRSLSDTSVQRYEGCVEAFEKNGMHFDEQTFYHTGRYSYEDGYAGMQAVLRQTPQVTAVFAMADVIAIGAIRALVDAGKRVPDDLHHRLRWTEDRQLLYAEAFDGLPVRGASCPAQLHGFDGLHRAWRPCPPPDRTVYALQPGERQKTGKRLSSRIAAASARSDESE